MQYNTVYIAATCSLCFFSNCSWNGCSATAIADCSIFSKPTGVAQPLNLWRRRSAAMSLRGCRSRPVSDNCSLGFQEVVSLRTNALWFRLRNDFVFFWIGCGWSWLRLLHNRQSVIVEGFVATPQTSTTALEDLTLHCCARKRIRGKRFQFSAPNRPSTTARRTATFSRNCRSRRTQTQAQTGQQTATCPRPRGCQ